MTGIGYRRACHFLYPNLGVGWLMIHNGSKNVFPLREPTYVPPEDRIARLVIPIFPIIVELINLLFSRGIFDIYLSGKVFPIWMLR
jgi:hypothetical protein